LAITEEMSIMSQQDTHVNRHAAAGALAIRESYSQCENSWRGGTDVSETEIPQINGVTKRKRVHSNPWKKRAEERWLLR
jgi:hypothetical protein